MSERKYKCVLCGKELAFGRGICYQCECSYPILVQAHQSKLEEKRKYMPGDPIESIDELCKQKLVYIFGGIKSIGFVISLQLKTVTDCINSKGVFYAIKKDDKE